MYICRHTYAMYTCRHTYARSQSDPQAATPPPRYFQRVQYTYIHTYIHTYIYIYAHTYTHLCSVPAKSTNCSIPSELSSTRCTKTRQTACVRDEWSCTPVASVALRDVANLTTDRSSSGDEMGTCVSYVCVCVCMDFDH